MKVWRIHIKNDIDTNEYIKQDLYDFCLKEKLIGVGWGDITTRVNSVDEIRKQAQLYPDPTSAIKALNAMRQMKLDDLIWTRIDGMYYLCRVTGLWENSKPNATHYKLDISNYVNVEWLEIGMEQDVPGKVVNSFRPASSAQSISNVEEISMYMWNKYSKKDYYKVQIHNLSIWSVLSAEAIEELVLLYLQIEKGYYIFSSTVKKGTFRTYECEMINKEGKKAYPQVKSGNVSLDAKDYMGALKSNPDAEVYLFSASESYNQNDDKRVHFLYKKELEHFIKKHKNLLPSLTYYWIEFCGFFKKTP